MDSRPFHPLMQISLATWSAHSRGPPCWLLCVLRRTSSRAYLNPVPSQVFNLYMPGMSNVTFSEPWAIIDIGHRDQ